MRDLSAGWKYFFFMVMKYLVPFISTISNISIRKCTYRRNRKKKNKRKDLKKYIYVDKNIHTRSNNVDIN